MENENTFDSEDEISLLDLWNIFKNRFPYFLVTLIIVVALAFGYLQTTIPKFSSSVTVLVDPIQSSSSLDDMLLSGMSSNTSKIQTEVELITSNRNLQSALSLVDLSSYINAKGESYDTFYKISPKSESISVTSVKDTNLVSISVTDENPEFAAELANAIATSYDKLLTGIAKTSKTTQREFLESQIPLNEQQLQEAANALSDYKEESGIIQLDKKSASLVTQIAYFDIKEEPLKLSIENNDKILDSYKSELSDASIVLPSEEVLTSSKEFKALMDSYSAANNELIMYNLASSAEFNGSSTYSDASSKTSNLVNTMNSSSNKMLDIINKNIVNYVGNDIYVNNIIAEYGKLTLENIKSKIELSLLQERSKVYNSELDKLPVIERKVTDLERNVTVLQQVGLELRSMLEQVKLTEAAVSGNVTVIDEAQVPLLPVSPNKMLIMAVSVLLGMALGFLMCILVNLRDNVICTRDDIKKAVGENIPLLGWIPLVIKDKTDEKNDESQANKNKIDHSSIFVYNSPNSLEAEKVLSITSNLLYGKTFENNQVISINSCDMSAGKSTILSNIGMSLVRTGAKVIIIDGDLRLPSVAATFGYSRNKLGTVEVVMGKEKLEDVIVQPIVDVPNLHILPVGHKPQVPSSILSYTRIKPIIDKLRKYYDYILIDAPPVSYASEVLTIGQLSDAIIINVRAGVTTKDSLKELLDNLVTVESKISGVVLNGFVPSKGDFGGRSGDYGYGKYGYAYNNYGADTENGKNVAKKKRISAGKAKRMEVKQYKKNLEKRTNRDAHFEKLREYAPLVPFLDFSKAEKAKTVVSLNNNDLDKTYKSVEDEKKESVVSNKHDSLSSILEGLKNDKNASGKKS